MMSVMKDASRRTRAPRGTSLAAPPPIIQTPCRAIDAVTVARYIADMTAQLETMAIAARLDLLAYFLAMARAEGEASARALPAEPACDAPLMV
jgi:hypothetical protein